MHRRLVQTVRGLDVIVHKFANVLHDVALDYKRYVVEQRFNVPYTLRER